MINSQNSKFDTIENTDVIVGIDIAKNVHWAGIILPMEKKSKNISLFIITKKDLKV